MYVDQGWKKAKYKVGDSVIFKPHWSKGTGCPVVIIDIRGDANAVVYTIQSYYDSTELTDVSETALLPLVGYGE